MYLLIDIRCACARVTVLGYVHLRVCLLGIPWRPSLELTHGFFVRRFLPEIANMTAPRKPVWQTFKTRNSTRRNTGWSNVASTQFVIRQTMIHPEPASKNLAEGFAIL